MSKLPSGTWLCQKDVFCHCASHMYRSLLPIECLGVLEFNVDVWVYLNLMLMKSVNIMQFCVVLQSYIGVFRPPLKFNALTNFV